MMPIQITQNIKLFSKISVKDFAKLVSSYIDLKDLTNLLCLSRSFFELRNDSLFLMILVNKIISTGSEFKRHYVEK